MDQPENKHWRVVQSVELGASAEEVWKVVGGFFTIHHWHPDITETEVPPAQTDTHEVRRLLTFPGQPKTTEELLFVDNDEFHYRYKWHEGEWGEKVQQYFATIRVFDLGTDDRCVFQWSSTFFYFEDALSEFYWNGFRVLQERFPLKSDGDSY